ncbi:MAG: hypothetical protein ABW213_13975 [Tardiphaga sp.]
MTDQPPTFPNDIALVYLARYAEGAAPITRFVASYQRHRAGVAHDLIVVRKGFPAGASDAAGALSSLDALTIAIGDEGIDISAYAVAAQQLPHRQIAFLNTFSEIAADDWLQKLQHALADPSVGAAGATGSYESPRTSMRRLKMGLFRAQSSFAPSLSRLRVVFQFVRRLLPKHLSRYLVNRLISRLVTHDAPATSAPDPAFEAFWIKETQADGTYDDLNGIPDFPNPHLRTNGFMIDRELFLALLPPMITTKGASYLFESGAECLTAQLLRRRKKVVVVGGDGTSYDIAEWPQSRTFRLGDQSNLLIHDNQTRAFAALPRSGRAAFTAMAWGDEVAARS